MARRRDRGFPQSHSSINLPQDTGSSPITPPSSSSTFLSFPRAASPSSITGFLSKPSKWFSRPSSNQKLPASPGTQEPPRLSTSSGTRRPTISGPTDPRPILPTSTSEGRLGASRSVLDLSLSRTQTNVEGAVSAQGSLGDLRNVSRKGWSRSVDDLGKFPTTQTSSMNTSNIKLSTSPPQEDSTPSPTKARIEAYRQNSPHSSPHSLHPHYPFPTIQTTSATPPNASPVASRSIPDPATLPAHGRSFSHAPFQSSKLASPSALAPGPSIPPQALFPQPRNRTGSSFERERERERDKASRAGFSFPFSSGGGSSKQLASGSTSSVNNTAPLQPPPSTLVPRTDSKRMSQIVHYSGFINRHPDYQPSFRSGHALATALSKGWKPYKAVLKGSKLYFYKPPGDRTVAVKDLFPQGMDIIEDEDSERPETVQEEAEPPGRILGKEREEVSRKRVRLYRGRATHPELSLGEDGSVARGSSDALIHEAVFGTSFTGGDPIHAEDRWKHFASAVMLCLPRLIGRDKFEGELIRYASYLINGADDTERSRLQSRTLWLAQRYIRHQGGPANGQAWSAFTEESLPSLPTSPRPLSSVSELNSPDLGAFSPRPSQTQNFPSFPSLSAIVTPPRPSLSRPSLTHSRSNHSLWAALEKEGLTSDVLLKLDSNIVARSLGAFHRSILATTQQRFLGVDAIGRNTTIDTEGQASGLEDSPFAVFFGSDENPHWLTRLIVIQVLNTGTVSGSHPDSALQVSKTHLRAEVINKWVRIGEHCRLTGDHCSWKAIEAALCSRPIARLDKVWRRVDGSAMRSIQAWIKGDVECPYSGRRPTPWGGDLPEHVADLLHQARVESGGKDDQWDAVPIQEVLRCVEPVVNMFSRTGSDDSVDGQDDEVALLGRFWQSVVAQPPPRSPGLSNYLSQSLAAEPRQKGRFEPYHWQRPLNAPSVHKLVPLLFAEPLPTVTLIDRDQVHRGKKESLDGISAHPGLDEVQVSRMTRMKSTPDVRRQSHDMKGRETTRLLTNGEMGGTILRMHEGELLLLVPKSLPESNSRPPSSLETGLERRPSQIRVSNAGLDRKTSVARRSSLPSISQRSSITLPEPTSEATLRVVVKAGTLDRLVDVLITGFEGVPVAVADDNGEMPLREGRTRLLKLDRAEFRATWWSVFRSFVSPLVFFELLRKRYLSSGATVGTFSPPRIRLEIFMAIHEWIEKGGGAQDALGDAQLFDDLKGFLATTAVTKMPESTTIEHRPAWFELENARHSTISTFLSQTRRPKLQSQATRESISALPGRNFGRQPPLIDDIDPETLVENLDALAATALGSLTQEDFFITVDLLEVQSADRTGWFLSHEPSTSADDIEIQTIYSHLQQIEPSILISELAQESFYKLLPPSVRSLVRAHAVVRKWAMASIVAPQLGLRTRQTRMESLLQVVEICRLRMADVLTAAEITSQRSVRSFVETAIISAIVSPESRIFSLAWMNVAAARGVGIDSVATLLSKPVVKSTVNKGRLTVDVGWLLERFLEVISVPNIIDSEGEPLTLVNFDKRRHLSDLILTALSLSPSRSRKQHAELDRVDIDRLNNMHREVTGPPFDARLLREEAYHESINLPPPITLSKKNHRPFLRIIQIQQEKCKRDKFLRERLLREKKAEQQRTDKREDDLNKAMHSRHPNPQSVKHQRSRRTMSSAFFHLMRPLSSAFSSDNLYVSNQRRTAAELDFEPSGKPSLVISLVGANVTAFINNVRLYTFHLTTEDGGRYLLQAATRSALTSWLTAISQTAKSSTAKRLTYIANAPKPQISDHIQMPSQTAARHRTAVFGVELDFLLQREADGDVQPGAVPHVLEQCLSEIEAGGLQEVGLYRIPGASSAINALRHEFDSGEEVTFFSQDYVDIFAVCDTVKTWFRSLPHAIFPERSYYEVIRVIQIPDFEERLAAVRDVVHGLPVNNFYLLRRICEHLERVTDYEEHNHMTAQALSVLFNVALLRSPLNDFGVLMHNMNYTSQLLQTLIIHFHRVFDETEVDVDQDDEAEVNLDETVADLDRTESRSSSVPTDAIHDHDPDLEPPPSLQTPDPETFVDSPLP